MKVASNKFNTKIFTPVNLYPRLALPPCQVEEQPTPNKQEKKPCDKAWQQHMRDARRQRKLKEKLQRINKQKECAMAALESLEEELLQHTKEMVGAVDSNQEKKCTNTPVQTIPIPEPPTWSKSDEVTDKKLKELTLAQKIPTAIADTGASSNCGM